MSRAYAMWATVVLLAVPYAMAADNAMVADPQQVSTDRMPVYTVVPAYPEKARRERVEGEVQVCFNVNRDGKTHRVKVRNSTNRVFEKPSRDAVRASTYKRLADDQPLIGIKTCRTFRFFLSPVAAIETPE